MKLWAARQGIVALELALVLPVFLFMAFAVLELGLELLTQMVLDHAVAVTARQVQIGAVTTASAFTTSVCNSASVIIITGCTSNMQVYVTSGASFAGLSPAAIGSSGTMSPASFAPGTAGADLLVEVAYSRPYLFQLLSAAVGSKTNTLLSVVALQSEPY